MRLARTSEADADGQPLAASFVLAFMRRPWRCRTVKPDRGSRHFGTMPRRGFRTKPRVRKARWGMERRGLSQRPPDHRIISISMVLAPHRRNRRRPMMRSIFCNSRSSSSGGKAVSSNRAPLVKRRRDGPSGGVVKRGEAHRVRPISASRSVTSRSRRAGGRSADKGRLEPSESA